MGSWGPPEAFYCKPCDDGVPPVPKPKYKPVLDPLKEEEKKRAFRVMRKPLTCNKVFGPFTNVELLQYDINPFTITKNDPILPGASYPKFLVCHICGGSFGPKSLDSHIKVCTELFEARESQREPGEPQKDVPSRPSGGPASEEDFKDPGKWTREMIDTYNEQAMDTYLSETLHECERCGRKFVESAFKAHYNGCDKPQKPDAKIKPCENCGKLLFSDEHRIYHFRKCRSCHWDLPTRSRKTGMPCYVCGKEFTEGSIDRHVATCEKLWVMREENKVYPDERLPLPPKVSASAGGTDDSRRETLKQCMLGCGALKQCETCGRSFFAESYEKHIRGCGTEETIENFRKRQAAAKGAPRKPGQADGYFRKFIKNPGEKGVCCYICCRKFGYASIEIHLKNCQHLWKQREIMEYPDGSGKEGLRKPVPERPQEFEDFLSKKMPLKKWNSWVIENCGMYVPCKKCGRTFLPDRLPLHEAGCKEGDNKAAWKC